MQLRAEAGRDASCIPFFPCLSGLGALSFRWESLKMEKLAHQGLTQEGRADFDCLRQ